MVTVTAGYLDVMPDEDALTPDAEPSAVEEEHTRISDKRRFTGNPEMTGVPEEEGIEGTDLEERLDEDEDDEDS